MLDFLSLPSLNETEERDLTDEERAEIEAEAKRERIKFHRAHVRNGPVKFGRAPSEKQERRRALARQTKKAARAQRQKHVAVRREHAILRGQLQALGVIGYETDFTPSDDARFAAARWVVTNFGPEELPNLLDDGAEQEYLRASIQAAFDRFSDLSGVERSEIEYA